MLRWSVALGVASLVATACGGGSAEPSLTPGATERPPATATPMRAERPPATATPAPAGSAAPTATPDAFGGVRPVTLTLGDPVPFPEGVALYAIDGAWEGPSQGLRRYYRDPSGTMRTDDLLLSVFSETGDAETRGLVGVVPGPNSGDLAAGLCHGWCYGGWQPVSVVRSEDGGITWEAVARVDEGSWGTVVGIVNEGVLVRPGLEYGYGIPFVVPASASTEPLRIPPELEEDASFSVGYFGAVSVVLGVGRDGRAFWNLHGSAASFLAVPLPSELEVDRRGVQLLRHGEVDELVVPWSSVGGEGFLGFVGVPFGDIRAVYRWEDDDGIFGVSITRWLTETVAIGWVRVEASAFLPDAPEGFVTGVPAVVDFEAGTVSPIEEFLRFLATKTGGPFPITASIGPFARIVDSDTCLNVRAAPALDPEGAILACYSDGVLLRTTMVSAEGDGRIWLAVTTPNGESGWAAAEFLEY